MMHRKTSPINSFNDQDHSSSSTSSRVRRTNSRGFETMMALADNFAPGNDDVIVGRGKRALTHPGNLKYKHIVATRLDDYLAAECRIDKTAILMEVIHTVRQNSPCGGFVKQNPKTSRWYEVGDFLAKEKTAQAFRDALHEYYSSSNPSKKKRRVESTTLSPDKPSSEEPSSEEQLHNNKKAGEKRAFSPRQSAKDHSLVTAMHRQFTRRAYSAPTTPSHRNMPVTTVSRCSTPPPSFSRFVSCEPDFQQVHIEQHQIPHNERKPSVNLGDTLALLSTALLDEDVESEDPFEPIPLSMFDDADFPKFP